MVVEASLTWGPVQTASESLNNDSRVMLVIEHCQIAFGNGCNDFCK